MAINIRAAAVVAPGQINILSLETPDLRPGEVLVKVRAVALCTLEQRVFKGGMKLPLPFLGGHEVAGEIAALGAGVNAKLWSVGDRVAVRMLYSCGECYNCRMGHTNMCVHAQRKPTREGLLPGPGGLCDYVIVQANALFPIADSLPFEEASLTEPLACCVHSIERGNIQLADDVVVIGGGIMGLFHVMLAKRKGARVILSEVDPARQALGRQLGADLVVNPAETDPVAFVKAQTGDRGADVVFNTTAIASVVAQAIAMTGSAGRMVQYSSMHPDAPVEVSPQLLHRSEMLLTGSISPDVQDFFKANRLLSGGIVDAKPLIAHTFPFERAQEAFEIAIAPGMFRVIITD